MKSQCFQEQYSDQKSSLLEHYTDFFDTIFCLVFLFEPHFTLNFVLEWFLLGSGYGEGGVKSGLSVLNFLIPYFCQYNGKLLFMGAFLDCINLSDWSGLEWPTKRVPGNSRVLPGPSSQFRIRQK